MLHYKDFAPQHLETTGILNPKRTFTSLKETLHDANAWIAEEKIRVLNVETVVLPNIYARHEEGTEDVDLMAGNPALWHQFIRVWYEA